jgi:23S rRNA (cytosine1962-C5)-methyltransferase
MQKVILKPGKEKPVKAFHPWIFSGAVAQYPKALLPGEMVTIHSSEGDLLGSAYVNKKCSIAARMVSFADQSPLEAIKKNLKKALELRKKLIDNAKTTVFRWVNAEGDRLPGLIVDVYDKVIVIQITTAGMEQLKSFVVQQLLELAPLTQLIYEHSKGPSRKEEGLDECEGVLYGQMVEELWVKEAGLSFKIDILEGQKTGFFIDQRNMRAYIGSLCANKRVLNCFSYSGGFSVSCAAGGAQQVTSVDISEPALALAKENMKANGFDHLASYVTQDAFEFLKQDLSGYDLAILDPPAFAKKKSDIIAACRGYKQINRLALKTLPAGSLLLTCSCSYHIDAHLFQQVIFQAAKEAGRQIKILSYHHMSEDHPINLYHPQQDYLKSLLLYVDNS